MASDFHGRSYLMESKKLIIRLIEILRNEVINLIYTYN